jgi:hypothetical protein
MKTVNVQLLARAVTIVTAALALSSSAHAEGEAKTDVPQYAGALTFAPDGTLFVGDNISSAVFAYKTDQAQPEQLDPKAPPLEVDSVDNRIASIVHSKIGQVEINGMAVHPTSREICLSVSRHSSGGVAPAIVKVSLTGKINELKLNSPARSEFKIKDAPTADQHFADRAGQWPVPSPEQYHKKATDALTDHCRYEVPRRRTLHSWDLE